jgi:hypothetical protein
MGEGNSRKSTPPTEWLAGKTENAKEALIKRRLKRGPVSDSIDGPSLFPGMLVSEH